MHKMAKFSKKEIWNVGAVSNAIQSQTDVKFGINIIKNWIKLVILLMKSKQKTKYSNILHNISPG